MIRFEKVSFEEYYRARSEMYFDLDPAEAERRFRAEWEALKLPVRSTAGSAGYDFFAPFEFTVYDSGMRFAKTIPSGIRFVTDRDDIVLLCFPRSGLGFNHGFRLLNTTGVIDSDYQYTETGGHIMGRFDCITSATIPQGKAYMQGIIVPFLKTTDDETTAVRKGGFGSTDQ